MSDGYPYFYIFHFSFFILHLIKAPRHLTGGFLDADYLAKKLPTL